MVSLIAIGIWLTVMGGAMLIANVAMWKKMGQWFKNDGQSNLFAFAAARLSIILTINSYLLGSLLYWEGRSVRMTNEMAPIHWMMSWEQGSSMIAASVLISWLSPFTVMAALILGVIAILWGRGGRDPRSVKVGAIGVALNSLLIIFGCGFCVFSFMPSSKAAPKQEPAEVEPYRYHGEQPKWSKPADVAAFGASYKESGYTQIVEANWYSNDSITEPTIVFASQAFVIKEVNANLVLVAQSASINKDVTGDVEFFGQSLSIRKGATIDGNLHIHGAQVVRIQGDVTGQITGNYNKLRE